MGHFSSPVEGELFCKYVVAPHKLRFICSLDGSSCCFEYDT